MLNFWFFSFIFFAFYKLRFFWDVFLCLLFYGLFYTFEDLLVFTPGVVLHLGVLFDVILPSSVFKYFWGCAYLVGLCLFTFGALLTCFRGCAYLFFFPFFSFFWVPFFSFTEAIVIETMWDELICLYGNFSTLPGKSLSLLTFAEILFRITVFDLRY